MSSDFGYNKEYNPDAAYTAEMAADGAIAEPSNVDFRREDREAEVSETSGRIPQSELNDLRSAGDKIFEERTRGRGEHNGVYKQERDLDAALEQEGAI